MTGDANMRPSPNELIRQRREQLGLSDLEVSRRAGLSISEYGDLEQHRDEAYSVLALKHLRKICQILELDLADLFDVKCTSCRRDTSGPDSGPAPVPRNILIGRRRRQMNLTTAQLSSRLGFEAQAIQEMEADPDFLEGWPVEYIQELADQLTLPLHALLEPGCRATHEV